MSLFFAAVPEARLDYYQMMANKEAWREGKAAPFPLVAEKYDNSSGGLLFGAITGIFAAIVAIF